MKVTDIDALRRMKELNSAGRYDESVNVAIALLNVNKENVEALDSLGLYYLAKKKFAKAAACFHKALSLDEDAYYPRFHLALANEGLGELTTALENHKEAASLSMPKRVFSCLGAKHQLGSFALKEDDLSKVNLSFSLCGEDLILLKYFFRQKVRNSEQGFYVDIGCNHPIFVSNTYLYYCYGWSGVCIDANSDIAPLFSTERPRDHFVSSAVGEQADTIYFAVHKKNSLMSRIQASPNEFGDGYQTPTKVPMRPLKVILEDKVPDGVPIDFFSIDVEDSELGVVRSNDWSRFRPRLIVMETHTFRMEHPRNCLATALLLDEGYEVIGNFAGNVFLKDSSVTDNR